MKRLVLCLFMGLLLSSCLGGQVSEEVPAISITPTMPSTPLVNSSTPTATPSKTPLKIWNRVLPPSDISQYYTDLEEITLENVHRIEEIARWGKGTVKGLALSPDKSTIAVSTRTGIYFYDTKTLSQTDWIDVGIESDTERRVWCTWWRDNIDYSPDGQFLAISDFNEILIWDKNDKKIRHKITPSPLSPSSNIIDISYNLDGSRIVVTHIHDADFPCRTGGRYEIYDSQSYNKIIEYPIPTSDLHDSFIFGEDNDVFFRPGNKIVQINLITGEVIGNYDKGSSNYPSLLSPIATTYESDELWSVYRRNNKDACFFLMSSSESSYPRSFEDSKDGNLSITLSNSRSGELFVWDIENCKKNKGILIFPEPARYIDFSPKGNYLLTGSSGGYYSYVWDVSEGKVLFPILADDIFMSPTEDILYALNNGKKVTVFDIQAGEKVYDGLITDYTHDSFFMENSGYDMNKVSLSKDKILSFSPDYDDGHSYILVRIVKGRQEIHKFLAPLGFMQKSIAISPDGRLLAFRANDSTIRIWGVRKE